ncbi:RCC1 and BTB domain-containing protein 1-like [Nylanderia fulva]|uniref:RCC1 and BTB domain-containing protein 1-like n=1 Tax=Nylanderia fulva TaxID=613905 RepID=UPI0010FBB618|nr:RCC1 and BTB domain-containing protein 1-like [Nylanderia fulva]
MYMVYDSGNRALIVMKDKKVYTLEYNSDDHLQSDRYIGIHPKEIEELCERNIKSFACNTHFAMALTENGKVYCWNFSTEDIDDDNDWRISMFPSKPTRLDNLNDKCIIEIACSDSHYLALTSDGEVYAWGKNTFGQIGNGIASKVDVTMPSLVDFEEQKIAHISCGANFSMVVTDTGKVYGWGNNDCDQISFKNINHDFYVSYPEMYKSPYEITEMSDKRIIKVACGSEHTLALTNEGYIYAWGFNNVSQLGIINNNQESSPAGMVDIPEPAEDISAHGNLSVALTNVGIIYVWGECFGKDISRPLPTQLATIHDAFAFSSLRTMVTPFKVITNDFYDTQNIYEPVLFDNLGTSFNDSVTYDAIFKVEEHSIFVRKAILQNRCNYFIFYFDWTKNDTNSDGVPIYFISDFSYITYNAFLKYLYTRKIDLSSENIIELIKLAIEYDEISLKTKCYEMIYETMTESNVLFFYKESIEYNFNELEELSFKFARRHIISILMSEEYFKLDRIIMKKFLRRVFHNEYKAFFEYLYTRKIDLSSEYTIELMKLADVYADTDLKDKCRKIIEETMVISNVALYYNKVIKYNVRELQDLCLEFILHNAIEVLQSDEFHKLEIYIKNKIIRKATKENVIMNKK